MKTGQDIYDLAVILMDGDEFSSDEDAEILLQVVDSKIRSERDWNILKTADTLTAGTTSLAGITDLDKELKIWANMSDDPTDVIELKKANFEDRFNPNKDYWIDLTANEINWIDPNTEYKEKNLFVDYKYAPDELTLETEIVFPDFMAWIYSYELVMNYKEADENSEFYNAHGAKYEILMNQAIDWNESLYAQD